MCEADELPAPRRKRDVKQAVDNVLEQLRLELMETYRVAAAQQESNASSPIKNCTTETSTTHSKKSESFPLSSQHVAALDDYRSVIINIQSLLQTEFPLQDGQRDQLYRTFFGSNDWAQLEQIVTRIHAFLHDAAVKFAQKDAD